MALWTTTTHNYRGGGLVYWFRLDSRFVVCWKPIFSVSRRGIVGTWLKAAQEAIPNTVTNLIRFISNIECLEPTLPRIPHEVFSVLKKKREDIGSSLVQQIVVRAVL